MISEKLSGAASGSSWSWRPIALSAPPYARFASVSSIKRLTANLGLRYSDIDEFLEGGEIDPAVAEKIEARFLQTRHKRAEPVTMFDAWWRG